MTKTARKPSPKKTGRPKVTDPRKTFPLRLTGEERRTLKARAKDLGVAETVWARMVLRRALGLITEDAP